MQKHIHPNKLDKEDYGVRGLASEISKILPSYGEVHLNHYSTSKK